MNVEELVGHLEHPKRNGDGWVARCPAHEDRTPSLSISEGADGRTLLHCHAGCTVEAIVAALGLRKSDLFVESSSNGSQITAAYPYTDELGALIFEVLRYEPKTFRQRRPDGSGGWIWETKKTRRVLFRLPQVLAAVKKGRTVWVCEGEKDVLALERAGEVATCNPMGAGKWRPYYATALRRADVVIVRDKDEEGANHAAKVAESLNGVARSVIVVEAAEGKDAHDHLAAGKTVNEFIPVTSAAEESPPDEPESANPAHDVNSVSMTLDGVHAVVTACFPGLIAEIDICLAVTASLLLEDQQNPVAINFEGPPSSAKTTLIDFLDAAGDDKVYRSDKFTPKSFVSHSASVSREQLDTIDLLPRIRHRVFLVPELAPLFGLRNEDLLENFSILTRVLDGQGLSSDSGVHGRRGHTGDYLFAWIGATTPIEHRVWKTMGKLGSRFLFFEMPNEERSDADLVNDVAGGDSYRERVQTCRAAVASFLVGLWRDTGGVRAVTWDRSADPTPVMLKIAAYAKVLAKLRGIISVWREGSGDDETYNFSTPVIESPHRALSLLYALARGHALVHGRTQLTEDDLPLVARAALESTPNDRRAVMRLLRTEGGFIETSHVEKALRCSAPTARAILETLDKLGIGEFTNPGAPVEGFFTLADSLRWLLEEHSVNPVSMDLAQPSIENNLTPSTHEAA